MCHMNFQFNAWVQVRLCFRAKWIYSKLTFCALWKKYSAFLMLILDLNSKIDNCGFICDCILT